MYCVPRLEDLITALIVDAFNALADAIEAAEAAVKSEKCGPKILASCLAYRALGGRASGRFPTDLRQSDPRLRRAGRGHRAAGAPAVRRAVSPVP